MSGHTPGRHDYLSTACHHGLHDRCRQDCKFCDEPCRCECHNAKPDQAETRDGPAPDEWLLELIEGQRVKLVRVLAANEKLVDAIEQALDDMGEDGHCVCEEAKQLLRGAIAKATGEEAGT